MSMDMTQDTSPSGSPGGQTEQAGHDVDLSWVTAALELNRAKILTRWLEAALAQPFHAAHSERAVSDHIPRLFDALIAFLQNGAAHRLEPNAPLDDPAVLTAARAHAQMRAEQGLEPADIVVEFRLLRQEIWRALLGRLPETVSADDIVGAALVLNDALDGAITIGLGAITERIETVREDFLATTIHEVRQPITIIKGAAQFAGRQLAQPDADREALADELRRIVAAADRMSAQIALLIDASRVALGRLELQTTEVDLAALAQEAAAQLGPETAARIKITLFGASATGIWDRGRLEQVLTNLLSNAAKYSPPDSPIEVAVTGDGDEVQVDVRDYGLGIAPEDLPKLFQRYGRTRDAMTRGIDGLGLGLYLCRGIVEAHGGRIWAESPGPGRGTTMHVVLPRRPGATSPEHG
jgi:signal transduction histidine kinase